MSVIGESGLSRALMLHMCCNELPIPDYRPFFVPITLSSPARRPSFSRREAIVSSSKSSRTREEASGPGPRHQLCAHMQITVPRCNHAPHMVVHHYLHDTSLRRLVNRRIARAFGFTQPAYRACCCFPKKRPIVGARFYRAVFIAISNITHVSL